MNVQQFIKKWHKSTLKERSASQSHFNGLCALLGEPTPTDVDPDGTWYTFERGAKKTGWALAVGSTLEDRPAYATTTYFETFPFPAGLTPADNVSLPPLQGEGWGGDGVNGATETHPHPSLPPEGEGASAPIFCSIFVTG